MSVAIEMMSELMGIEVHDQEGLRSPLPFLVSEIKVVMDGEEGSSETRRGDESGVYAEREREDQAGRFEQRGSSAAARIILLV